MKPCLSGALTMSASFEEDLANCAEAGCPALEVWLTKLEDHLQAHDIEHTRSQLARSGVLLPVASFQGGILLSQGDQRRLAFDHFQRRLDLCKTFGIGTLILVPDFEERIDAHAWQRAQVTLKQSAQLAASYDVRLALEFRGNSRWCASLQTALALIEACGEENLGVCLDVFHYYTGPSKFEDFAHLSALNLAHVQLCDLAGVPRELATDADRILPGDGDFQLEPIMRILREIGYAGWISVECLNPLFWQMKPAQVAQTGYSALQRILEK